MYIKNIDRPKDRYENTMWKQLELVLKYKQYTKEQQNNEWEKLNQTNWNGKEVKWKGKESQKHSPVLPVMSAGKTISLGGYY